MISNSVSSNVFPSALEDQSAPPQNKVLNVINIPELKRRGESSESRHVFDLVTRMFSAESSIERVEMAHVILQRQSFGLPYLVLARETESSQGAAEFYRLSARQLKIERSRQRRRGQTSESNEFCEPYELAYDSYIKCILEAAHHQWKHGCKNDAIKTLLDSFFAEEIFEPKLFSLAVAWLIQTGSDRRARRFLRRSANATDHWSVANALLLYRRTGNSPVSMAALEAAYSPELLKILDTKCEPEHDMITATIKESWRVTPGALEWLGTYFSAEKIFPSSESDHRRILQRLTRWLENFRSALALAARNEWNECRRFMKMALKEAEMIGGHTPVYDGTLDLLEILVDNFPGSNKDDLVQVIGGMHSAIDSRQDPLVKAWSVANAGRAYRILEQWNLAEQAFADAKIMFDNLQQMEHPQFDYNRYAQVFYGLGCSLVERGNYLEALANFRKCLHLQEQYLGTNHPELSQALDCIARCLHHLGRHTEEGASKKRITELNQDQLQCEHDSHGPGVPGTSANASNQNSPQTARNW